MLHRTRDGVYNSIHTHTISIGASKHLPRASLSPPHTPPFCQRPSTCCCCDSSKVKVDQNPHPAHPTLSPTFSTFSLPISTFFSSSWIVLVALIVTLQLLINYAVLRTTYPSPFSSPAHSNPSRLTTGHPTPPRNRFLAEYFTDSTLPQLTNTVVAIDFQPTSPLKGWTKTKISTTTTTSFPPSGVNRNAFKAVFRGLFTFNAEQYRFVVASSSGVRVWIDDVLLLDEYDYSTSGRGTDMDPLVEKVLLQFDSKSEHMVTVEFHKKTTVQGKTRATSADGREFTSSTNWIHVADELLSTHLHVHWLPDALGLKMYLYDLPARFNSEIVETNVKCASGHMFGAEMAIHQQLLRSIVRTTDPREADLFYVPVYSSCKTNNRFFGIDPWFGKRMITKSVQYIAQEYPFWRQRQGQDHVFAMTYDYGACFEYKYSKANQAGVLRVVNNAILLSTISDETVSCFRPSIDVPIPTWIDPRSPMSAPLPPSTHVRDWKVYFQGSKEWKLDHDPEYSNGLRSFLFQQYSADIDFHLIEGKSKNYVDNLRRSTFCLCPRGFAVWSPRVYESVLSGCIPVILADGMHLPFGYQESGIDWRRFSIMIPETKIKNKGNSLKKILFGISDQVIRSKQAELRRVRKTMLYSKPLPWMVKGVESTTSGSAGGEGVGVEELAGDAFAMIMKALREKARAMKYVSSKHGPGFWL